MDRDEQEERDLIKSSPMLPISDYELEEFIPVTEEMSVKDSNVADLNILNNHLALLHFSVRSVRTIDDLCKVSLTVVKLIEARRKVKELPFGVREGNKSGRVFEVLE